MMFKRLTTIVLICLLIFVPTESTLYAKRKKPRKQPIRLYDTHAHYEDDGHAKLFIKQMRKNRVMTSVLLNMSMNPKDPRDSYDIVREEIGPYDGAFKPFFSLNYESPTDITRSKLNSIWSVKPKFKGIGEFAFYRNPLRSSVLTDAPWPDIFQFASEKNIFVMIHLRGDQQVSELETMLNNYPHTKILLHGPELPEQLPSLLQNHNNLYYTLDTATLLWLDGQSLMYPNNNSGSKVFIKKFDKERKEMLKNALETWKPVIAAAPDRVVWGTDASYKWHLQTSVYKRLILFSRDFIKRLPKSQRTPYAWGNAKRALGAGIKL